MKKLQFYKAVLPPVWQVQSYLHQHWFKVLAIGFLAYFCLVKDISFQLDMKSQAAAPIFFSEASTMGNMAVNTSLKNAETTDATRNKKWKDRKANRFSNLGFILNPTYAKRHQVDDATVDFHVNNCKNYVKRFAKTAIVEQEKYGIPASITLAQGLLESDAGDSRLAVESLNHFGIKCRSKCKGCTCRNYTDDSAYDMFRVFASAWESYREHSILLTGDRYKHLLNLEVADYKNWAHGLKKAGYATDKRYAEKLIKIIEYLKLNEYDRIGKNKLG
ncbi:MAG: glucosaminidase domain-containing protein [Bacteroidota bacterium]